MSSPDRDRSSALVWLLGVLVALGAILSRPEVRARRRPSGVDPEDLEAGYELSDMRPSVIIAGAIGLVVVLGALLVVVTTLEAVLTGLPPRIGPPMDLTQGLQAAPHPTPPPPALEAQPAQSLQPYVAAEQHKLNSYRWVDRQAGIAAIPIDRAMDLIAQQGLPARTTGSAARDQGNSSPSSASSGRVDEAYP